MKNIEQKIKQAMEFHDKGFNCAQAVAMPFAEDFGLDTAFVARAMEGFGAGMGGRNQACGALSGVVFLAGLKNSDGDLETPASKQKTYKICAEICDKFEQKCGATVCKDIKKLCQTSCNECIKFGVFLACEMLD